MNNKAFYPAGMIGLILSLVTFSALIGCAGQSGYSGSAYGSTDIIVDDDYVYYPGYEVYYSTRRHNYIYRDGRHWVSRPAPPRVRVDVLVNAPSVHVDFHDSPEHHHSNVVKSYPKNWRPAQRSNDVRNDGHPGDRKDDQNERSRGHRDGKDDDDKRRS